MNPIKILPHQTKKIRCPYCHAEQKVLRQGLSTSCNKCRKRINLRDYAISSTFVVRELITTGMVLIGENGHLTAEIHVGSMIVDGKVTGNVTVDDRIEIHSTGKVFGNIRARRLLISEGAVFVGKCYVNPNKEQ